MAVVVGVLIVLGLLIASGKLNLGFLPRIPGFRGAATSEKQAEQKKPASLSKPLSLELRDLKCVFKTCPSGTTCVNGICRSTTKPYTAPVSK